MPSDEGVQANLSQSRQCIIRPYEYFILYPKVIECSERFKEGKALRRYLFITCHSLQAENRLEGTREDVGMSVMWLLQFSNQEKMSHWNRDGAGR